MADHALAAIRKHEIHGRDQKRLELRLYRLGNQPTRARSQDFGERIIDGPFLTEGNNSILGHGVTLLLGGSGGLITNPVTPPSSYRHPVSPVARDLDVLIDADAARPPFRELVRLGRQRPQRRTIDILQQLPPRCAEPADRAHLVEMGHQIGDRRVDVGQAVKGSVA